MACQLINPFLMIVFGFAPKNAGSQRTRSAIFPTPIDPTTCERPNVNAD